MIVSFLLLLSLNLFAADNSQELLENIPTPCEAEEKEPLPKSVNDVGGKKNIGNPENNRFSIDGPANLRDAPSGKVINKFANGLAVLVEGHKGEWYLVRGYYKHVCESGWTHKNNLLKYSRL